jgi:hypothetical protein
MICWSHWFVYILVSSYYVQLIQFPVVDFLRYNRNSVGFLPWLCIYPTIPITMDNDGKTQFSSNFGTFGLVHISKSGIEALPKHVIKEYCRGILCHKDTGYHTTDQKIRTQGAVRVRSRSQRNTVMGASRCRRAQTKIYLGSGPSWWGKTPTSCLLVLWRDNSRGVQGLVYKALIGRR